MANRLVSELWELLHEQQTEWFHLNQLHSIDGGAYWKSVNVKCLFWIVLYLVFDQYQWFFLITVKTLSIHCTDIFVFIYFQLVIKHGESNQRYYARSLNVFCIHLKCWFILFYIQQYGFHWFKWKLAKINWIILIMHVIAYGKPLKKINLNWLPCLSALIHLMEPNILMNMLKTFRMAKQAKLYRTSQKSSVFISLVARSLNVIIVMISCITLAQYGLHLVI